MMKNKKILVVGSTGQLGSYMMDVLREYSPVGLTSATVNYRDPSQIFYALHGHDPDIIINCAAYTDVEDAETPHNINEVEDLNVHLPYTLASWINIKEGGKLIHFSTDYVFGENLDTYHEMLTEESPTAPLNVYGRTKRDGEEKIMIERFKKNVLIFRVQALYSRRGRNFWTIINALASNTDYDTRITVTDQQYTTPTHAKWVADLTKVILKDHPDLYGLYHMVPHGEISYYEFARHIVNLRCTVEAGEYKTIAKRAARIWLDNSKLQQDTGLKFEYWNQIYDKYAYE